MAGLGGRVQLCALAMLAAAAVAGCASHPGATPSEGASIPHTAARSAAGASTATLSPGSAVRSSQTSSTGSTLLAPEASRATVPVLCYHQIRDWRPSESRISRGLATPPALFAQQMAYLSENGWHPISLATYYEHIVHATPLPSRPIVLTFDDGHESQMDAVPVLQKYKFPATFFLMTVVIGKKHWITSDQIRSLDAAGFTIGAHTYDHQNLAKLPGAAFQRQIDLPRQELERIVNHPIKFFAYPYGAWNTVALTRITTLKFDAAFQLSDHKMDSRYPLLTLRRQIANPLYGISGFQRQIALPINTSTNIDTSTTVAPSSTSTTLQPTRVKAAPGSHTRGDAPPLLAPTMPPQRPHPVTNPRTVAPT